ncbi:MAG: hypothetical protein HN348_36285, partial [Proteobacteria bacterium]|nr:hypothetical protein [Pseudomonadota bacterium]
DLSLGVYSFGGNSQLPSTLGQMTEYEGGTLGWMGCNDSIFVEVMVFL